MEQKRRAALIAQMTLEEKAGMCSGLDFWHTKPIERLGIPSVMFSDGPHGLRKQAESGDHLGLQDPITAICFPAGCATACSFDRELMRRMGEILGDECCAENVSVLLGPAVNIKRSPLCGRNFEYLSEDPFAAGEMASAYINGVQSRNVGTSIKHFAANNQEHERMYTSSDMDERTLREIYLPAFETAIRKSSPKTVMCSYNRLNGTYVSENRYLLQEILRDEWDYQGFVMSDWGAVSNRVAGLAAGMDLEMPGSGGTTDKQIADAVQNGILDEKILDRAVGRILDFVFDYTENHRNAAFHHEADHAAATDIAKQCMVLLKNDDQILPLAAEESVCIIGGFAEHPRYQGGGSSHIKPYCVPSAVSLAEKYGKIVYCSGFPSDRDESDPVQIEKALKAAAQCDKIVVFAGLPDAFESEGYDRVHMRLPDCQNALIAKLADLNKPIAVVLHNGSPVEMPWIDRVQGILEAYLCGEGTAEAVMDILYGKTNPCGRLSETFPKKLEDNPSYLSFPGSRFHVHYDEGIFVGYRYYEKKMMPVLFPFGHGLSYTDFSYDNLTVNRESFCAGETVDVTIAVTNTGKMRGKEIVQLYVSDKTGCTIRPEQELKGFEAVTLEPGETKTVTITLDMRAFSWYSTEQSGWYAANGLYEIRVGRSSADIRLTKKVCLHGAKPLPLVIDDDVMIGTLLRDARTEAYAKQVIMPYLSTFTGEASGDFELVLEAMVKDMPLRSLRSFGGVTNQMLHDIKAHLSELVKVAT